LQLEIIVLSLVVVGLLLYQVIYASKLKDTEKRLIGVVVIIVVTLWLVSQIFMYFAAKGTPGAP
jgi:hypothetical protein